MADGNEQAVDAAVAFVTIEEKDANGVPHKVEYRARPLGVRDYIDLQAWMRKRTVENAIELMRETGISDPAVVGPVVVKATETASRINLLRFDNPETAEAFNEFDTWVRFVYYSLRHEHPKMTLDRVYAIMDKVADASKLVTDIQTASTPDIPDEQKKTEPTTTEANAT